MRRSPIGTCCGDIGSDGGRAAFVRIPGGVKPALAERGFRVCESQEVLEMEGLLATRSGYFVVNRVRRRFPEFDPLVFRCFDTRLGGTLHRDIRRAPDRQRPGLPDCRSRGDGVRARSRFSSGCWRASGCGHHPNARVRWTNHLDFWVEQTSNSLGFLDREPAVSKPDGMFRVLVIGDSFVEAIQVRLMEKMHVLLEARLRDALDTDMVDTVAFGRGGTGQSNQLGYYDRYGADIDADLVVLLFVNNDFRDNLRPHRVFWRCFFHRDEPSSLLLRQVLASTEHALWLFKRRTETAAQGLLLVITDGVTAYGETGCATPNSSCWNTPIC